MGRAFFLMNTTMWLKRNVGLHCQEVGDGNVPWCDGEGKMEKRSFYLQILPWTQKKIFFFLLARSQVPILTKYILPSTPFIQAEKPGFYQRPECACVTITKGNQTWDEERGRPPGCGYPNLEDKYWWKPCRTELKKLCLRVQSSERKPERSKWIQEVPALMAQQPAVRSPLPIACFTSMVLQ